MVEATASYEWFVQLIEPTAARIVLAHPGKLRVIAESKKKTDKLDARGLAAKCTRPEWKDAPLEVVTSVTATLSAAEPGPAEPVTRAGYFYIGGRYQKLGDKTVMVGQMFVQYQIPKNRTNGNPP